jgi:hypothetical protein
MCTASVLGQQIFDGDGSTEPGFVPPPVKPKLPAPPPRTVASAETFIPFPGPPAQAMARSEAKKPPRPPVVFTKLRTKYGPLDWSATPNDIPNLLKSMKSMIDVDYAVDVKSLAQVDADPKKNPILYRSGHYHFSFTPQERAKLRSFMLDGGMIVLNTGLGSKPFYDSAVEELTMILPEARIQRLSSDHPVFHAYYDVDRVRYRPAVREAGYRGDEPWFDGVSLNCRTVAVISRWGMAVGWAEMENDTFQAYATEDAKRLGINLFAYATAQRAWTENVTHSLKFVDQTPYAMDKIGLGQVIYDGEWKTRHAGVSVLLHTFNVKTDVPVHFGLKELRISDAGLFDTPMLYMTGHENFQLQKEELTRLRQYLLSGGFLLAEACCGRKGFDLSFRAHMRMILPDHPLELVPADDLVFTHPNTVSRVGVTPALSAQLKDNTTAPQLYGAEIAGRYAVIYSPFGMAGGWEMSQNPYAHGYDHAGSILLGQNILMYAITQ